MYKINFRKYKRGRFLLRILELSEHNILANTLQSNKMHYVYLLFYLSFHDKMRYLPIDIFQVHTRLYYR